MSIHPQQERYLLLTLTSIQFSHVLDFMVMMPLGPLLIAQFGISTHEFGWLVASYSFAAVISGILSTTFIDRFERKRILLIFFGLFGIATLACALAPNFFSLLIARGLAGFFGGVMGAQVQTMAGDCVPFERRAKASSFIAAAFSISTIAGVPLSLWLANHFGWRSPFVLIVLFTIITGILGWKILPEARAHLQSERPPHLLTPMINVLRHRNHQLALLFSSTIIFSGFIIIPYITLYAVHNIGLSLNDIPMIYLFGGAATLITGRLIGYWADKAGKVKVFRIVACCAILPLCLVTQTAHASLAVWLCYTTLFFILVSGRMIPAIAIIISSVQPPLRGSFMSLNAATQQLASGLGSILAGYIITQSSTGMLEHYNQVGWIALAANISAIALAGCIVMNKQT